jgi:hypothetical protein
MIYFLYKNEKEIFMKIYKQYIPITPNLPIYTDIQGELLTIEQQGSSVVAYFNADSKTYHKYLIYMIETGVEINAADAFYIKTLMLDNGNYVLHLFLEEIE